MAYEANSRAPGALEGALAGMRGSEALRVFFATRALVACVALLAALSLGWHWIS